MSVAAKKWVRKHSPARGSRRTVLLELAWAADGEGRGANLSTAQLADATGLSARTVKRALADLERERLIDRHRGDRSHCSACAGARRGAHVFDVPIGTVEADADPNQMSLADLGQMTQDVTQGQKLTQGQPDTTSGVSVTPQEEVKEVSLSLDQVGESSGFKEHLSLGEAESQPAARARTREAPPVSYRGRTVPRSVVLDAERLLGVFGQAAPRQVTLWTGDGRAGRELMQVIAALVERPGEPLEVWERGLRSMLADPPEWVRDGVTVGHVFGERAAAFTIARGHDRGRRRPGRAVAGRDSAYPEWRAFRDAHFPGEQVGTIVSLASALAQRGEEPSAETIASLLAGARGEAAA